MSYPRVQCRTHGSCVWPVWIAIAVLQALSSFAIAEDGYRLWLRYERTAHAQRLAEYQRFAGTVVVQADAASGGAIENELQLGLGGLTGSPVVISKELPNAQGGLILVGTPADSPLVRALNWDQHLSELGKDGFVIRHVSIEGRPAVVVASAGRTGLLYGVFNLLARMQRQEPLADLQVAERPAFQRRMLNHWDNPNGSIERGYAGKSLWQWDDLPETIDPRYTDYARACASIGINGAVLNNVNAKPFQLSAEYLKKTAALANALRPYGVRVYLSANFGSPKSLGGLPTADPLDPAVIAWWKAKADEIYTLIPDFGGFLIKANSEGQPGPRDYKRSHAEGANCIADALAPHGGVVMYRCFVYEGTNEPDRAKRAYKEFAKLDGQFRPNVSLQVKNGPIDFQPREMPHPLFGAMPNTPLTAELEITQENTGQSTHLVFLAPMWTEFLTFDTFRGGKGNTIAKLLRQRSTSAIAGVANTGIDRNWCGHDFAQANWYAFGRLAWNPELSADAIAEDWARRTWGNEPMVVRTVTGMMRGSREAMVDYQMPIGLTHIMEGGSHYTPAPKQFADYHKAGPAGIGYDRSSRGSNAVGQYAPEVAQQFDDPANCPDEWLLWFHHVPWDFKMKSGRTVWDELQHRYTSGVEYVKWMQGQWDGLRGKVDDERFAAVQKKLAKHAQDAGVWRDKCLAYFQSKKDGK